MSYIYKITNIITNKMYVGYTSQSLSNRFASHKWEALNTTYEENKSRLYCSIRKYGVENFVIEPIIEFNEKEQDWKKLEQYYIKKLNTLSPNGYNLLPGGELPPVHYGDENIKTKLSDADLLKLIEKMKDSRISYRDLSKEFDLSIGYLYLINEGKYRHQKNVEYPIRKFSQQEIYALQIINILANDTTLSNDKIAAIIPNYFRPNEIASINNGKKYAYLWNGDFPIRKQRVPVDYDEKQKIALKVVNYIQKNNYCLTKVKIQSEQKIGRRVLDEILKGIYPYNLSNINYPIKLKK